MKRDMDLIRRILLAIEDCPEPLFSRSSDVRQDPDEASNDGRLRVEGYGNDVVSYHVMILDDAGLITAHDLSDSSGIDWWPISLTWAGHEFLDAAREPNRWEKAKKLVKDKTGSLSFDVIKAVLLKIMTEGL